MMGAYIPLQVGAFLDIPPLLGPVTFTLGYLILFLWFMEDRVLPMYFSPEVPRLSIRVALSFPLVVGLTSTAGAYALWRNFEWFVVLLMFSVGRAIEGAVALRFFRKVANFLGITGYRERGPSRSAASSILKRIGYYITQFGLLGVGLLTAGWLSINYLEIDAYYFGFLWAILIGMSVSMGLMWDFRRLLTEMQTPPVIGMVLCIVGAEVYEYPVVLWREIIPLPEIIAELPLAFRGLSIVGGLAFISGQIAFLGGIILSYLFYKTQAETY